MSNPLTGPIDEKGKLFWETVLFILGIIILAAALYFVIFHYDELPEFTTLDGHSTKKAVFVPFIPGILLMFVSRYLQNLRTDRCDFIGPVAMPNKKKSKTYKWEE